MASPPPPPPPAKASRPLTLKLKTTGHGSSSTSLPALHSSSITTAPLVATPGAMSPPPATPSGGKKIILKRSQPSTPAAIPDGVPILPATAATRAPATPATPTVTMTQKGRVSKPTAKKRAHDFDESDDDAGRGGGAGRGRKNGAAAAASSVPPKRPKLILKKAQKPKMASIVLKQVHKEAPPHSRGEGYDSEEDDREPDPMIEEEFVLRMLPGEHCDYLNKMVEERKIGVPIKEGGADFHLRWLPGAERRAMVTVNGTHFVGVLVDLPTITEGMKTWDKRNFMKSADICQMLLVFAKVADDVEAKSIALPGMVTKDFRWPHGLTPPMHDCIHRRFRKRLSKKEIKDKEAELQRLLNEDRIAVETKWELFDDTRPTAGDGGTQNGEDEYEEDAEMMEDGEEDAYGDVDEDYFNQQGRQQQGDEQADAPDIDDAELEAMFMEEDVEEEDGASGAAGAGAGAMPGASGTGAADSGAAATPATQTGADTPAASGKPETPAVESEASDADDDEDDDDDDMDEDELAQAEQVKGVREDINDLKKQLQALDKNLATTQNPLLRKRIEENKKRVMSELRLKQASIGEVDEEE